MKWQEAGAHLAQEKARFELSSTTDPYVGYLTS